MRTFFNIVNAILAIGLVTLPAMAYGQWHQGTDHNPWSVEVGGKFFVRPGQDSSDPLITSSITGQTLFDVKDATSLGNAPAAEVKFNFLSRAGQEWEFRSIIADWNESSPSILGPNLDSPFIPDGAVVNLIDFNQTADFFSFDLMSRRSLGRPGLVWMFGPRYVSSSNTLTTRANTSVNPGDGAPTVNVLVTDSLRARNSMLGLQAGLEINKPLTPGIYVSGFAKAGGYFNSIKVDESTTDNFTNNTDSSRRTRSHESFIGEAGGRIYVDIIPQSAAIYAGYEANWLDGFAAAPAQFLGDGSGPIHTSNTIFFHGVTFGFRYTY